ncbi:MAG: division/cell wall cluster transcriptional repressor MraZ [Clostridia bacterium]|nr:division/cell wall cluster transcriptional repressor MraZ [Clostridia bacterium]
MLIGQSTNKIDEKKRLVIPQEMRDELGEEFYITNGLDGCLFVMSVDEFTLLHNKISEQPMAKVKKLQRYFFGDATKVKPDKQGRVLLTPALIKCGNLSRDVVVLGADNRVELWDADTYAEWHDDNTEELSDDIARIMEEVGI